MKRETEFVMSHRPYAVDLSSLRTEQYDRDRDGHFYLCLVDAVWFRRRRGVTVACTGILWTHLGPKPVDAAEFLVRHTDGRYGGDCDGRWDGENYWGTQNLTIMGRHLELLRPMLAEFPAVPEGFDGWWRF